MTVTSVHFSETKLFRDQSKWRVAGFDTRKGPLSCSFLANKALFTNRRLSQHSKAESAVSWWSTRWSTGMLSKCKQSWEQLDLDMACTP